MIIMLLYENKYFVEKIEIRKNMIKDLTVSLRIMCKVPRRFHTDIIFYSLGILNQIQCPFFYIQHDFHPSLATQALYEFIKNR